MAKSDHTKYASEIPMLHAWDPSINNNEIKQAQAIALKTRQVEYKQNVEKTLIHKNLL
jgi:hypothetical protein